MWQAGPQRQTFPDGAEEETRPDAVIALRGVPHTRTGKELEVPVKRLIPGAEQATVVTPRVVGDPSLLDDFALIAHRRQEVVRSSSSDRR